MDEAPQGRPASTGPGRTSTFWTTVPGLLTGVAALLTAVVGAVALWQSTGAGSDTPRPQTVAPATGPDVAAPGAASAPGTTVPGTRSGAPAAALRTGELTVASPEDADLETGTVGRSVTGSDLYLYCSSGDCLLNNVGGGRFMTAVPGPVDRDGCVAALQRRQDGAVTLSELPAGSWLCLQTSDGHVAAVEPLALPGPGTPGLTVRYTVWP